MEQHWLPIVVGVFLVGMMLYGHYRGFLRQCISVGALVLTLVIVKFATPYVSEQVKQNPQMRQAVSGVMLDVLGLEEGQEAAGGGPSYERAEIEGLNLPQQVKDMLIENNNSEVYSLLGVSQFVEYVGACLADMILSWACTIFMFLLTWVLIHMMVRWLNLLARLPIIHGLNKIAGTFLGLAQGLILLWVGALFLNLFSATPTGMELLAQVEASPWLSFLYHYNMLDVVIQGVLRGAV